MYKIPCNSCNKCYIGETGRDLSIRLKEHIRDVKDKKISSAPFNHFINTGHSLNYDNTQLIYKNSNVYKRHLVESSFINCNKNICINQNLGFAPVNITLSKCIFDNLNLNK